MEQDSNLQIVKNVPMIAVRGAVLFPNMFFRFDVSREKSIAALKEAANGDQMVFIACQKDAGVMAPQKEDIFEIGSLGIIKQVSKTGGMYLNVLVEGVARAKIVKYSSFKTQYVVTVQKLENGPAPKDRKMTEALVRTAHRLFAEYMEISDNSPGDVVNNVFSKTNPGDLADYMASNSSLPFLQQQELLEETSPLKRLKKTISHLAHLNSVLLLENEIEDKVKVNMDKNQREYYLKEQMRTISEELGEESELDEYLSYRMKITALNLDPEIKEKLEKEAGKLLKMPQGSHESPVIRNYLDSCLDLPWNTQISKKHTIKQMKNILDRDHYGMKKVKDRILEHMAVGLLAPEIKGQVLCLVGPPGTGKSSVARSIARAGGRKFAAVSLGGVRDEADIRGHRKTYIGAMYGRIISALLTVKCNNPVILLDEVDKLGHDYKGDPTSALLELLDSEQNSKFVDHYIEIPFDLSNVFFITTANYYENIPAPLLDRMEVIHLSSYTSEEKKNIARKHLLPKQLEKHGITGEQLRIDNAAMYALCENYTREAGVRNLEREIASLCRKTALAIASGELESLDITMANIEKYLGTMRYKSDPDTYNGVGVATGLAWTSVGGDTLPIEVSVLEGTGKIQLTGSLGDIMKESATTAISYARSVADNYDIDKDFYKNKDIHIHVPEGAVPKDGPSAGITLTTAVISALSGRPVKKNLAMTGEMTLRGNVLPIGGLREKAMAAYRKNITNVIIPENNRSDLQDIDAAVVKSITFTPVKHIEDVLNIALY